LVKTGSRINYKIRNICSCHLFL